ncbi:hypothetical protein LCGC14_2527360 [marine sediment metagenome]|uniref:Uncharacterized protein n=1 Tax=marine sediment metagenome TaxID=412755 RepID=A0A0F9AUN0_9ZZZZ
MAEDARVEARRRELLAKGYPERVVQLGMTWAVNSAEGQAAYFAKDDLKKKAEFQAQFLSRYLEDASTWVKTMAE